MTLKEELIQVIERSPETKRMYRKQGVLVIEAGESSELDINTFISEMREQSTNHSSRKSDSKDSI